MCHVIGTHSSLLLTTWTIRGKGASAPPNILIVHASCAVILSPRLVAIISITHIALHWLSCARKRSNECGRQYENGAHFSLAYLLSTELQEKHDIARLAIDHWRMVCRTKYRIIWYCVAEFLKSYRPSLLNAFQIRINCSTKVNAHKMHGYDGFNDKCQRNGDTVKLVKNCCYGTDFSIHTLVAAVILGYGVTPPLAAAAFMCCCLIRLLRSSQCFLFSNAFNSGAGFSHCTFFYLP